MSLLEQLPMGMKTHFFNLLYFNINTYSDNILTKREKILPRSFFFEWQVAKQR